MLKTKLETMTPEQLTRIHEATLQVLEKTGIVFEDEEARELLRKHGATIEGDVVHFTRKMVEDAIAATPESFVWNGLDKSYSVGVGGDYKQVIGPSMSVVNILEDNGVRRPSNSQDSIDLMKLNQASKVIQVVGMNSVEPIDLDPKERHLRMCYEALKNARKPLLNYTVMHQKEQAQDVLTMLEMAKGSPLGDEVYIGHTMCPFSPLKYETPVIEVLKEFVKKGQPIMIAPCALTGLSAPIDLLGSAVLQNAENLAMVTFVQLYRPGTPLVMHFCNNIGYMRRATTAWGSPESILLCITNIQLCLDLYHIPCRIIGGVATSKKVDYQAGFETMQSILTSILSGVNIAYINSGAVENLLTISKTKYVMDDEILSRALCIREGVPFSEERLCLDDIHEVGHGGTYLYQESTLKRCRERWVPLVSNWDTASAYEDDILVNAKALLKERLENAPETFLDSELDKELKCFIEKRLAAY